MAGLDLDTYRAVAPAVPIEWAPTIVFDPSSVDELIEDVLVAGGMSVWYGEPGSGKTTLLLDAMLRMPRAKPWLGKRIQRRAAVLVAAESPNSVRIRLEAFRRQHGDDIGSFGLIPAPLNLMDPSADVDHLIDLIIKEEKRLPVPVGLIAVDTVARVMPGANENAGEDMSRLVAAGDRIRKDTGAHVAFIHHTGKDASKGARGHSSLKGAIDTEIEVTYNKSTGIRTLEITKQRDLSTEGMKLMARFVRIELGLNRWGKPITGCVVEPVEPASPHIEALVKAEGYRRAESCVLAGFRTLRERGFEPSDKPNSNDYLPKQLLAMQLASGFSLEALRDAMRRLMSARTFERGVVGKYAGNRTPRMGLVLVAEECTK